MQEKINSDTPATTGGRHRVLRLFGTSVVDQAVLSAANLIVGLLLIRETTDLDYGYFVLVQSAILLLVSAQGACISAPLAVLAPKKTEEQRRAMVGTVEANQRRLLLRVLPFALLVPPAGVLCGLWSATTGWIAAAGVLASWCALQREYLRSVLLIYSRPQTLLLADLLYVTVLIAGTAFAAFGPAPAGMTAVLAVATAGWVGWWWSRRTLSRSPGWVQVVARPIWMEMRPLGLWALFGTIAYWMFSQSYNYLMASRLDINAVASANAARLMLMPIVLMTVGVRAMLVPSAAAWLQHDGVVRLTRRLGVFAMGLVALNTLYFGVMWVLRDWLCEQVLHKQIPDRESLLLTWFLIAQIAVVRDCLQCGLLAMERFRALGYLTAISAVISLAAIWFGIGQWGVVGAVIGQGTGELIYLLGIVFMLARATWGQNAAPPMKPRQSTE